MRARLIGMLLVGLGAAVGANLRYLIGQAVAARWGSGFPYGTLIINLAGSFGIGLFFAFIEPRVAGSSSWRLLLVTGLLGGFTTFSAFSYEAFGLIQQGRMLAALLYCVLSVVGGLLATAAAISLVRMAG